MSQRAISYRRFNGIPAEWGTAVTVQSMVFGNIGNTPPPVLPSPATRPPVRIDGEFLVNAQGEDVVAGIRTPNRVKDKDGANSPPWKRSCRSATANWSRSPHS